MNPSSKVGHAISMYARYEEIAKMIDHALLTPALDQRDLEAGIDLALAFDVASVCILPCYVGRLADRLRGSTVRTSTTIGFPHGANVTFVKLEEAQRALDDGAQELDMVINVSAAKSGEWGYVQDDIRAVTDFTHMAGQRVKVIFENAYLTDGERIRLCQICGDLGVDWIKTSTGFAPSGATFADLRLMRAHAPANVQIKAAGGMRTLDDVLQCREIGVTRVGTSATTAILNPARSAAGLDPISAGESRGY